MRTCVTGVLLTGLLLLAVPAVAQVCGDSNGDGQVSIGDMTLLIESITYPEYQSDPIFHMAQADCDGRAGITVSDAMAVASYLFRDDDYRDCSAAGTYSLAPAESDTIFIPYLTDIPSEVAAVDLPILASLTDATDGVYISLLTDESVTDNLFHLAGIPGGMTSGYITVPQYYYDSDSCSLQILEITGEVLTGVRVPYFDLNFERHAVGVGSIAPVEWVRTPQLRITVEQGADLLVPVIVYYAVELPDPTLSVDVTALDFWAISGRPSQDSYEISFTSTERPVMFDLDLSDDWIVLDGDPVGPFTTPITLTVMADATNLFSGVHLGTITPVSLDPAETILVDGIVSISFDVDPVPNLPWGDLNCSGDVTIGDISLMIECVFINPRPIPDCR